MPQALIGFWVLTLAIIALNLGNAMFIGIMLHYRWSFAKAIFPIAKQDHI